MNVLLIRHAESNGNAAGGDYSVDNADALSPKGLAQADALGACLASWKVDTVIVSPQQRALQTIAPYLARIGRTGEVWPELVEACWQDKREPPAESWDSQPAELPKDIARYFRWRDGQAIRPASDAFSAGLHRVYDTVERIGKSFGGTEQTIVMVSHGYFIREILNRMVKLPEPEPFHHDNTGSTLMSFDSEWKMVFCNRLLTDSDVSRTTKM